MPVLRRKRREHPAGEDQLRFDRCNHRDGLAAAGQFVEAQEAASKSKMWSWIGFGIGLVVILLNIILQVAAS